MKSSICAPIWRSNLRKSILSSNKMKCLNLMMTTTDMRVARFGNSWHQSSHRFYSQPTYACVEYCVLRALAIMLFSPFSRTTTCDYHRQINDSHCQWWRYHWQNMPGTFYYNVMALSRPYERAMPNWRQYSSIAILQRHYWASFHRIFSLKAAAHISSRNEIIPYLLWNVMTALFPVLLSGGVVSFWLSRRSRYDFL